MYTTTMERIDRGDGKLSMNYTTKQHTAESSIDFIAIQGTVIWDDKETGKKNISISILNDNVCILFCKEHSPA